MFTEGNQSSEYKRAGVSVMNMSRMYDNENLNIGKIHGFSRKVNIFHVSRFKLKWEAAKFPGRIFITL